MQKSTNERYEFIDLLKASAIFFVVIYHFNNLKINFLGTQSTVSYFHYFFKSILSTCVPIFFFVNGALLLNKDFNLKKHISKIVHLTILTIVWGILTLFVLMFVKNEYMSLPEFAKGLWNLKQGWINHLWYLPALVVVYIFFPLIKSTYDHNSNNLYFFLIIAFFMTFGNVFLSNCVNIIKFIMHKDNLIINYNYFNRFNAFRGIYGYSFVYFILGGLMLKHKKYFYKNKWTTIAILSIPISMIFHTVYGILISKGNGKMYDIVWNGYDTISTLCIVMAFFILSLHYKGENRFSRLIAIVGKNSIGIYFLHKIWGMIFIKYFRQLPLSHNIVTNTFLGIFILLISLFSVLILKKVPVVKKLFAI